MINKKIQKITCAKYMAISKLANRSKTVPSESMFVKYATGLKKLAGPKIIDPFYKSLYLALKYKLPR